ncbi:hypothetical protein OH76DRAFT_1417154 [Lentinus brumalis]|uniref:F-box domain-containing protein n=1 Tax=Lentinus brumalis TaxID=2498619 RepID=A0A371DGZ0_9APHY|nr:hypothetical protein OH76DRAFT_1417154 [Polyporus brumalis]
MSKFLSTLKQLLLAFDWSLSPDNCLFAMPVMRSNQKRLGAVPTHNRSIDDLPNEVLIQIFKFVLAVNKDKEPVLRVGSHGAPPVNTSRICLITFVCRRWRSLARDYPHFWSRIDGTKRDRLDLFLRLSRSVPVSLVLSAELPDIGDILALQGPRIRRLDLAVPPPMAAMVPLLLSFTATSLDCLTIAYSQDVQDSDRPSDPVALFDSEVVPLKALMIYNAPNWLPQNHFPKLTHLHMGLRTHCDHPRISSVCDFLRNTPNLTHLHIHGIPSLRRFTHRPVPAAPVSLPNLRSLTVAFGAFDAAIALATSLVVPSDIYCCLDHLMVFSDGPVAHLPKSPPLDALDGMTMLQLAADDHILHLVAESPSSGFWLQAYIASITLSWGAWLDDLHASLPLWRITTFHVFVGGNRYLLFSLLRHMPSLVELGVRLQRDYEETDVAPDESVARSLYLHLSDAAVCRDLRTLKVDIMVYNASSLVNVRVSELVHMTTNRGLQGSPLDCVIIQPFAGATRIETSGTALLSRLREALTSITHVQEVDLRRPGPPCVTFGKRQCWRDGDFNEYWRLNMMQRAVCRLPGKCSRELVEFEEADFTIM